MEPGVVRATPLDDVSTHLLRPRTSPNDHERRFVDGRFIVEHDLGHAVQERCLRVALEVLESEKDWLRGAFLWKWFVGEPGYNDQNFLVDTPPIRDVVRAAWGGG